MPPSRSETRKSVNVETIDNMGIFGKSKTSLLIDQIKSEVEQMNKNLWSMLCILKEGISFQNIESLIMTGNETNERYRKVQSLLNILSAREQHDLRIPDISGDPIHLMEWSHSYMHWMNQIQNAVKEFSRNNGLPF